MIQIWCGRQMQPLKGWLVTHSSPEEGTHLTAQEEVRRGSQDGQGQREEGEEKTRAGALKGFH